jgi:hypothetical protein
VAKSRINPKRKFPVLDQSHFKSRVENDLKHLFLVAQGGTKSEPCPIGTVPNPSIAALATGLSDPKRKFPVLDQSHFKSRVENDLKQKCCYRGLDIGKRFGWNLLLAKVGLIMTLGDFPMRYGSDFIPSFREWECISRSAIEGKSGFSRKYLTVANYHWTAWRDKGSKTDKLESVARKSGVDYDIGRLPYAVWFRFYTLLFLTKVTLNQGWRTT